MSLNHSPSIVTDGLVMYYDMPNGKSFAGAPVTNTLDTPLVNGYPTYGNGWATYNTNQYNGAQYFSIGTIASVSGNLVTTTTAHPLFSYSVVTPQSSGGGLTAGTNYLIKKVSATSFTIHAYNGSQDGSQGYINSATGTHKVFDDFANDVRVAVSVSGFPTMWWGPPHLPNSCLVKEIIPGGFTGISSRIATDCIRLHYIQPDGMTDGMAYGPNGAVIVGQQYTVTFWTRSVTTNAAGSGGYYQIYNHGVVGPTTYGLNFTLGAVGVWTKQTLTFTPINPNCISYWFPNQGNMKFDIANIQFEAGSVANNFVAGARTNTQSIIDLTGNNTLTANSLTYAADNTFSFNGTTSVISLPSFNLQRDFTLECWVKLTSAGTGVGFFGQGPTAANQGLHIGWFPGRGLLFGMYANDLECPSYNMTYNTWHHFVFTYNNSTYARQTFADGVLVASGTLTSYTGSGQFNIGAIYSSATTPFIGNIAVAKAYNRALSATEVTQNFNALRGRYSI